MKSPLTFPGLLVIALTLTTGHLRAQDDIPSFKERNELTKKFYSRVCLAILKAAHFTGKDPAMIKYELKDVKEGRKNLIFKASYKGRLTGKKYLADITVYLDTLDVTVPQVLRIDYSDNNNIPHSRKKLEELIPKLNGKK